MSKCARGVALDILESPGGFSGASSRLRELDPRDRALAKELFTGVQRWKMLLDYLVSAFSHRPMKSLSPRVRNALRIGIYQTLFMGIAAYAAIDSTVKCLKNKGQRGFANAILRTIERNSGHVELPFIDFEFEKYASVRYSFPRWIVDRYSQVFQPDCVLSLMKAQNKSREITLRVNAALISRDSLLERFLDAGYSAKPGNLDISIKVDKGRSVEEFPGYNEGLFVVQDEGAMLPIMALNPTVGEAVWDVCAAPGGKATHIAQMVTSRGLVVASDIDEKRTELIGQTSKRLGLTNVVPSLLDATDKEKVESVLRKQNLPLKFDKILVDAPCSGLGVIGKIPEIKWQRRESDIPEMAKRQSKILNAALQFLKPGGTLVYSTCTLTKEENENVWQQFVEDNNLQMPPQIFEKEIGWGGPDFLADPKGCHMYVLPHIHGTDGFFVAKALAKPV